MRSPSERTPDGRRHIRLLPVVALAVFLGPTHVPASDWTEKEATRDTMQTIFASLQFLLQLDASGESLDGPQVRQKVLQALRELDDQSAILASHGFYEDTSGMFLASVLERYSLLLLETYESREPEQLKQFLYGITDICIACHTRLPTSRDSPVAEQFVRSQNFASLPPRKRAKIQIATRRFDDALATLEALIESTRVAGPANLENDLRAYLIVNLRVKGDMERPMPVLELVAARSDPGSAWSRDVELWSESLRHFRDNPFIGEPLASARGIIAAADSAHYPSERSALLEYIIASSLLHRFLDSKPSVAMELSEAYYLLGLAEYRIHRNEWLPQAELYLEIAIVLAPKAKWALPAYSLLAEKVRQTYAWSADGEPPPEVEERLRELKQVIDGVQPSSAGLPVLLTAPFG